MKYMPLALALLLAAGCADDATPTVHVVSASPTSLMLGQDDANDLAIVVDYTDGDGDLGGGEARVHDCTAKDLVIVLPLPQIASQAAVEEGVAIEGRLSLAVGDVGPVAESGTSAFCSALGAANDAFCVVLVDAAGNESEGDCTAAITRVP